MLKPLNYHESGSLVVLWEHLGSPEPVGPNLRHVDLWRKRGTTVEGIAIERQGAIGLTLDAEHPQLVGTVMASVNLFDILQSKPLMGSTFLPEHGTSGRDNVAVLSYRLWRNEFHGDPAIVEKSVRLGDVPREVIGVMPEGFHFPNRNALKAFQSKQASSNVPEPAIFVPAVMDLTHHSWNADYGNWVALARLRPGIGSKEVQAELNGFDSQIVRDMPAQERGEMRPDELFTSAQPMQEAIVGDSKTTLLLLMAAVLGLMLIACLNLANAQLARTLWRQREASMRAAPGAPKWRLVWNSLLENLILALAGGVAGVALANAGLDLFRRNSTVDLPRLSEVHLDTTVLLFSIGITVGATFLFSLLPAWSLLRTDPQAFLQQGGSRTVGNAMSRRPHRLLVGLQVLGCTALLLITGLFSKNLLDLRQRDKGFETEHVSFAQVNLSGKSYGPAATRVAFIDGVLKNLRSIPGVQSAGIVSTMPLEGESWIERARRAERPDDMPSMINLRWTSPGYFEAMRYKLVAGRSFEKRDRGLTHLLHY